MDLSKELFDFAYNTALADATRRVFSGNLKEVRANEDIRNKVREYVNTGLFSKKDEKELSRCVETAKTVAKKTGQSGFTFGIAQKLINMTVKYLFVACYTNRELCDNFKSFDCAMDRRMINHVWKEYKEFRPNDEETRRFTHKGEKTTDSTLIAWSKLDGDEGIEIYKKYQKMARNLAGKEGLSPIMWELREFNRLTV